MIQDLEGGDISNVEYILTGIQFYIYHLRIQHILYVNMQFF